MRSSRTLVILLAAIALMASARWRDRHLQRQAKYREAHFLSIHAKLSTELRYKRIPHGSDAKRALQAAMNPKLAEFFLTPFPQGLKLDSREDGSFTLEEARPRLVSLFSSDRLVSTASTAPHWERSGKRATK
ncbi:hypothetical protein OJ996_26255 [Luteolibacter sp. GHJ8]|uniref:Uncharacterized protein n=1 Tax=Luteolibacter rhizosphaerae TaxID=2989719 RepID=A0ABT3GBT8_9BACT|nr:hypothetical protein [Luteolibacter rhizosphaerae]MCW1917117.1 hypothetical protein [Luteolibacter rhizosphaerae]